MITRWLSITVVACCMTLAFVMLWGKGCFENFHRKLRANDEFLMNPNGDNSMNSKHPTSVHKFGDRAQMNNVNFRSAPRSAQKQAAMKMVEKLRLSGESVDQQQKPINGAETDGKKVHKWSSSTRSRPIISNSVFSTFSAENMEHFDSQADCFKSSKSISDDEKATLNGYKNSSIWRKKSAYKLPPNCDDASKKSSSTNKHVVLSSGLRKTVCYHLDKPAEVIQSWYTNITTRTFMTNTAPTTMTTEEEKPKRKVYYSIFAGRKQFMKIHLRYADMLLKEHLIDEVHIWDICLDDMINREFLYRFVNASNDARYIIFPNPPEMHSRDVSIDGRGKGYLWESYYTHYSTHARYEEDDILIKADDDIVFLDVEGFATFLGNISTSNLYFPNIVNNDVGLYLQATRQAHPHMVKIVQEYEATGIDFEKKLSTYLYDDPVLADRQCFNYICPVSSPGCNVTTPNWGGGIFTRGDYADAIHEGFLANPIRFINACQGQRSRMQLHHHAHHHHLTTPNKNNKPTSPANALAQQEESNRAVEEEGERILKNETSSFFSNMITNNHTIPATTDLLPDNSSTTTTQQQEDDHTTALPRYVSLRQRISINMFAGRLGFLRQVFTIFLDHQCCDDEGYLGKWPSLTHIDHVIDTHFVIVHFGFHPQYLYNQHFDHWLSKYDQLSHDLYKTMYGEDLYHLHHPSVFQSSTGQQEQPVAPPPPPAAPVTMKEKKSGKKIVSDDRKWKQDLEALGGKYVWKEPLH